MAAQFIIDSCGKCGKKSLVVIGDVEEEWIQTVEGARGFMWQCPECKNKNEMPITITVGNTQD